MAYQDPNAEPNADPNDPLALARRGGKPSDDPNDPQNFTPADGGTPQNPFTPSEPFSPVTPTGGVLNTSGNSGPAGVGGPPLAPTDPVEWMPDGHGPELAPPVVTGSGGDLSPTGGGDPNSDLGGPIAARLRELFSQGLTPDLNDPALASERLQSQRNFENQRALLSERSGIEGTNDSGGFDTQLLGLGQERGAADLGAVAGARKDRFNQILQALQLASGNQNANNALGLNYAQLEALLNSQALSQELAGAQ